MSVRYAIISDIDCINLSHGLVSESRLRDKRVKSYVVYPEIIERDKTAMKLEKYRVPFCITIIMIMISRNYIFFIFFQLQYCISIFINQNL